MVIPPLFGTIDRPIHSTHLELQSQVEKPITGPNILSATLPAQIGDKFNRNARTEQLCSLHWPLD